MENIIEYLSDNVIWIRPIWFSLGFVGLYIMKITRTHFYKNRSFIWWLILFIYYAVLGPMVLFISLLTLINTDKIER